MIVKSDQEPAIKLLVNDIWQQRTSARTFVEESPKRSTCEGFFRSLKSQLDDRYLTRIMVEHPIVAWMCEHAAYLLNRLEVGRDGKTAYERSKGKRATALGLEFGEKILFKEKPVGALQKLMPQWKHGVFIGIKRSSGEVIISNDAGEVKYIRSVRRVPVEERWDVTSLAWVRHVPWNLGKDDKLAEGTIGDVPHPGVRMLPEDVESILAREASPLPHRTHRFRKDFEVHGFTDRCPGFL